MEVAFVFIRALSGKEKSVLEKVRKIGNVTESFLLYGDYDIMAKVETENKEHLQAIVMKQIRGIKGIEDTCTNFVFDADAPYL